MLLADRPGRGEQGFSLLESVIAVAVLGIIVSAMVGGMATTISMSALHRQKASTNAVMVSAAEVVKHLPFRNCEDLPYPTTAVPLPSGWTIKFQMQYWNPTPSNFDSTCRDGDNPGSQFPIQLVTILVTVPGTTVTDCEMYSNPKDTDEVLKSTACIAVVKRTP